MFALPVFLLPEPGVTASITERGGVVELDGLPNEVSEVRKSTGFVLSPERSEQIVGSGADILYPGANNFAQWYDNLRFQVAIDYQPGPSSLTVGVWRASGLVGGNSIALNSAGDGTFHQRVKWPVSGKFDMIMRYVEPSDLNVTVQGGA